VKELLAKIVQRLESGSYINEAAVRIGIIEPILARLGWDLSDPQAVQPEFSSEGRRVDYALCAFPARPTVFIEAKAIGKVEAADRQLFEYAFHEGVPFACSRMAGPGVSISRPRRGVTKIVASISWTCKSGTRPSASGFSLATWLTID
jgi:hypothetical protein